MEGLVPTFDVSGNNNNTGNWGGALIGGAVGGAVGSAWGRNNNNGCCNNTCCNNGNDYVMDNLTTMRSDINSIGRDNLMQAAANASANCQGFAGLNTAIREIGAQIALGQSRAESAALATSYQGQLAAKDNTFHIVSSQKDCCCDTQKLITAEGCATRSTIQDEGNKTRALIAQIDREHLMTALNDAKAENAALKAQQFATGLSLQAQNNIITHFNAMRTTTGGTTPAA